MKSIDRTYVENQTKKDAIHLLLTGSASLVPIVGDIIKFIFEDPAMKRRDDWIQSIANRVQKLEENNISIENLKDNENFISAVFYASSIAVKTHSEEKHKRLLNALTNTALTPSIDETKQTIFLNLINEFTELHILLLEFFYNPNEKVIQLESSNNIIFNNNSFLQVLKDYYKDKLFNDEVLKIVINTLYSNNLISINNDRMSTTMTRDGLLTKRTTNIGDEFIEFIRNPLEK